MQREREIEIERQYSYNSINVTIFCHKKLVILDSLQNFKVFKLATP